MYYLLSSGDQEGSVEMSVLALPGEATLVVRHQAFFCSDSLVLEVEMGATLKSI